MSLNYNNSIPLYIQLKEKIKQSINNRIYKSKIPSEREIMDEFYVSRSTVRQAVEELVKEGVLIKRPGKGTFIAIHSIDDWLGNLSSTTETIERMGMTSGAKLLHSDIIELPPELQAETGLDRAYHFKRLRYANFIPIGIEDHYYPTSLGEKIVKFDLNKETLYDILETKLGIHTFEAEQIIRSGKATKEEVELLELEPHASVLSTDRKLTDLNKDFVEYERAIYNADIYSFKIKLSRKHLK